ncbi:LysR family transcriptional regulator [Pseudonocardia sp. C8]|uniref:LysR family transcriptional regulator n=1 Tax=Pseudonocardia sp. C8 TaxID=2762759 RepID=UPI0016431A97|nr:LysR family transcriptional regulator [Pseudonocardia sp. C8]
MDIRHLRDFVAVAEELHVARAAARRGTAASPLSRRIRGLEHELGAALFVRHRRRLALTAAGEALLPVARDLVLQFDALPSVVREAQVPAVRTATVGIVPDISPALRRAFVGAVTRDHPDVDVHFRPGRTGPLLQAVSGGELDLALVHGPVDEPGLSSVRLDTAPAAVVVAADAGFDGHGSVALEELRDLAYASVRHDAAPLFHRRVVDLLRRHGITRHVELEGHDVAGLVQLVTTGRAFTLAGPDAGPPGTAFAGEPVVVLPVRDAVLQLGTVAVWSTDRDTGCDVVGALAGAVRGPLATGTAGPVY